MDRSKWMALAVLLVAKAVHAADEPADVAPAADSLREELRKALLLDAGAPPYGFVPVQGLKPGVRYTVERSTSAPNEWVFQTVPNSPELKPERFQILYPAEAIKKGSAVPPWAALLLKKLDEIDGRLQRLERGGKR